MTQPTAPLLTIRLRENGPLVVQGPFRLVDPRGEEIALPDDKPVVALCRCGQSAKKPFCDGSHKACGFVGQSPSSEPNSSLAGDDA